MQPGGDMADAPIYGIDYYCDDVIANPWPHYAAMRALGPVVFLPRLGNYAIVRMAETRAALRDPQRFISGEGAGGDEYGSKFQKGNAVASDGELHDTIRGAIEPPLRLRALETVRPSVEAAADALVDELVAKESFDAVKDFAQPLPLLIVRDLIGLPDFGRENMLKWASAAFNMMGMQNARGRAAEADILEMRSFLRDRLTRDAVKPGSWMDRIFGLVESGDLAADLGPIAMRDYINPSLDTTISALGWLIHLLSEAPEEWARLRAEPKLALGAAHEAVRLGAPIRSFSRRAAEDVAVGDVVIPKGARVMMVYAAANRDERVFPDPDKFDPTRPPGRHLGFGAGVHTCVGMHLALMEITALIRAMTSKVDRIETGEPVVSYNNTICAFASLPTRFIAAE